MTGRLSGLLTAVAGLLLAPAITQAQVQLLEPGVNRIQMQGQSFTVQPAIDIPAGTRSLQLAAVSSNGADIDLLLRYGEPFPQEGHAGAFGGIAWLYEHAHYRSMSSGPSENLMVTPYQTQPLRPGRWYLALVNYHGQATSVDITATLADNDPEPVAITVDFNDAAGCAAQVGDDENGSIQPWFDTQAATPVGGNPGTTLGEQRRNAFNHAMELIRRQAQPLAPVHVRACWASMGGDNQSAILASAGPYLARNDNLFSSNRFGHHPGVERPYTWYAMPAVAQNAGTDSCRFLGTSCLLPRVDIFIQFNSDIGNTNVMNGRGFYLGYTDAPAQLADFVATAMHEITHGLGFNSLLNTDPDSSEPLGAKFRALLSDNPPVFEEHGHNDIYADSVVVLDSQQQPREINRLTDVERASALVAGDALRWAGPDAVASAGNPWRNAAFPDNLPRLYAPDPVAPGSTLGHIHRAQELMSPFIANGNRSLGLAAPMLSAVGWNSERVTRSVPVFDYPYGGQWYDPRRNGHGIDLQRVVGTEDIYFLVFYTYDANGHPEWYTSTGRIVDGVFRPGNNAAGDSLWHFQGLGVLDTTIGGQIRIDFANAALAPECNDGGARAGQLALMDFSIRSAGGEEHHRWCLTQLLPRDVRPDFDTTGTWYGGEADSGWGISTLALPGPTAVGLNAIVYLFDENNQPRWVLGETTAFQPGVPFALHFYAGYCRSCEPPAGGTIARSAVGSITVDLRAPQGSPGTISMDFNGFGAPLPPPDGRITFRRTNSPMILLGESAPSGD